MTDDGVNADGGIGRWDETVLEPSKSLCPPVLPTVAQVSDEQLQSPMPREPHVLHVHDNKTHCLIDLSTGEPNLPFSDVKHSDQFTMYVVRHHFDTNPKW